MALEDGIRSGEGLQGMRTRVRDALGGDQFPQNGIFAHLAAAYRAVGRESDAQRAQTEATQRRLSRPRSTT